MQRSCELLPEYRRSYSVAPRRAASESAVLPLRLRARAGTLALPPPVPRHELPAKARERVVRVNAGGLHANRCPRFGNCCVLPSVNPDRCHTERGILQE